MAFRYDLQSFGTVLATQKRAREEDNDEETRRTRQRIDTQSKTAEQSSQPEIPATLKRARKGGEEEDADTRRTRHRIETQTTTAEQSSQPEIPATQTFQLLSDLHLELNGTYDFDIKPRAKYFLLPGDIGSLWWPSRVKGKSYTTHNEGFRKFLTIQCAQSENVVIIAGNHEYNRQTIPAGNAELKRFATLPGMENLVVLNNEQFDIEGQSGQVEVTILGCTLWTKIRADQPAASSFDMTGNGITNETNGAHNTRYFESIAWIRNTVKEIRELHPQRRILIMTHHAPMVRSTSPPQLEQTSTTSAAGARWSGYQNDILGGEGVAGLQEGDVWVFGHTHFDANTKQDNVRVIANQRGVPGRPDFNSDFTFDM